MGLYYLEISAKNEAPVFFSANTKGQHLLYLLPKVAIPAILESYDIIPIRR